MRSQITSYRTDRKAKPKFFWENIHEGLYSDFQINLYSIFEILKRLQHYDSFVGVF